MNRPYYNNPYEDLFTVIFNDFDKLFKEANENAYTCPSFPPVNVYVKDDKTIVYEFALAGYKKEDINIEFDNNQMILNLKKPEKKEIGKLIYHKLKFVETTQKYYLPSDKYIYDKAKAIFKEGILTVEIPSKEPKKVTLQLT